MELPFLPAIREKILETGAGIQTALGATGDTVKKRAFGALETLKTFGIGTLRDFPRSGAQLGLKVRSVIPGQEERTEFIPGTGAFPTVEKFLFGEEPIKIPERTGGELLQGLGVDKETADKYGGAVGYPLTILGAFPFFPGKKKVVEVITKETVEALSKRFGKETAQFIAAKGSKEFAEKALAEGGEDLVKETLKIEARQQAIDKLNDAIVAAKPIREVTEKLATGERAIRAARGTKALETPGEAGFQQALGKLKGELPKPEFEGVRKALNQDEVDTLFDAIKQQPQLDFYEKISASTGLAKILGNLGGQIPTEGELKMLQSIFGRKLIDNILAKRPLWEKTKETLVDILNLPRAIMSSMDLSAPLRQGLILLEHKPKQGLNAWGQMFKFFGSQKVFDASKDEIVRRSTFQLMKDSGLFLSDITHNAIGLSKKEERFLSNFASKIPIIGQLVRASERGYVGFLNKLRADVFDDITEQFIKGGFNPDDHPQVWTNLADFINTVSGRGKLGGLEGAAPFLNGIFFSPRFMASRLKTLNPVFYMRQSAPVRKELMKSMVKFVGTGIGVLGLAKLAGASIELDPRSSDFAKIRVGNVRWDIWAGYQQWTRFITQMLLGAYKSAGSGKVTSLTSQEFGASNRLDWAMRFFRGKLAPGPALITDLLAGQNVIGQSIGDDLTLQNAIMDKVAPIYIQDIIEAVREVGLTGVPAIGVPAFFGVGTQVFQDNKKRSNKLPLPRLPSLPTPKLPQIGR